MNRILLVEDEENIRTLVKLNLDLEGYEVVSTGHGKEAISLCQEQHFHMIILDIMLPDISGLEVCQKLRIENNKTPILILSAKDTSQDRIDGLKTGADDYLVKPFNLEELLLRVEKLISRTTASKISSLETYTFAGNKINFSTYEAHTPNKSFRMTEKELKLLKLLIDRSPEVVSRQVILQTVWGYDVFPSTRTIDNFILSFRKYFEKDPKQPQHFISVRGVGYKFISNIDSV